LTNAIVHKHYLIYLSRDFVLLMYTIGTKMLMKLRKNNLTLNSY